MTLARGKIESSPKRRIKKMTRSFILLVVAAAVVSLGAGPKKAALYTPAIQVEKASTSKAVLFCHVVNVSNSPQNGTIDIFRGEGTPLSSTSYHALAPGGVTGNDASFTDT